MDWFHQYAGLLLDCIFPFLYIDASQATLVYSAMGFALSSAESLVERSSNICTMSTSNVSILYPGTVLLFCADY